MSDAIKSKKDLKILLEYLKEKNYSLYCIFSFGLYSGLRISDILKVNIDDIDKEFLNIVEKKTGKKKTIPLNNTIKEILKDYIKNHRIVSEYKNIFISQKRMPYNRCTIYKMLVQACKECNIDVKIGTHTMRKTFGYHHYKEFKDVALLQRIFNHSSPAITLTYIGIAQDEINNSYNSFNLLKEVA